MSHEFFSGQSYWCICDGSRIPLRTELLVYLGGATNSSLDRVIGVSLRFHEVLSGQRYKCICDGLRIPLWIELLAYL